MANYYRNLFDRHGQSDSEFVLFLGDYKLEEAEDKVPKEYFMHYLFSK